MGTEVSSSDEWLELYNESNEEINLSGWSVLWDLGQASPKVVELEGSISANGYYLLERTDDNSVPGVTADLVYSGSLGNSGERVLLKNGEQVVEELNFTDSWPAGDNESKQTMQRDGSNWVTAVPTPRSGYSGETHVDEEKEDSEEEELEVVEYLSAHAGGVRISSRRSKQELYLDIGRDRLAVVGAEIVFASSLEDDRGVPLPRYEMSWSFGDGTTVAGKEASHRYLAPGEYVLVGRAGFGRDVGVARANIMVINPEIEIVSATGSIVTLKNNGSHEVNLGGFAVGSEYISQDTIILTGKEISVVMESDIELPAKLFSPLGEVVSEYLVEIKEPEIEIPEITTTTPVPISEVISQEPVRPEKDTSVSDIKDIKTETDVLYKRQSAPGLFDRILDFPRTSTIYIFSLLFK